MKRISFLLLLLIPLFVQCKNKTNQYIVELYKSKIEFTEFKTIILESYHLTKNWAFFERQPVSQEKIRLKEIIKNIFPEIIDSLSNQKKIKNNSFNEKLSQCILLSKQLIDEEILIMQKLQTFEDYENFENLMDIESKLVENGLISNLKISILDLIDELIFEIDEQIAIESIKEEYKK